MSYKYYDVVAMFSLFDFRIGKEKERWYVRRLRRPYTRVGYNSNRYISVEREQLYLYKMPYKYYDVFPMFSLFDFRIGKRKAEIVC
jgi:hypothetical protein